MITYGRSPQEITEDRILQLAEVADILNRLPLDPPTWSGTVFGHDLESLLSFPEDRLWRLKLRTFETAKDEMFRLACRGKIGLSRKVERALDLLVS